jgi:hypothetical protein
MGLVDGIMGDKLMAEMEKRMRLISNDLCPRMDALIREQQKTNELLSDIIIALRKLDHI